MSAEENTADLVEPPSEVEVNHAITTRMRNLLTVMKAVNKFKSLLDKKRPSALSRTLGKHIRTLHHPPGTVDGAPDDALPRSKSADLDERRAVEGVLAAEGIHHDGSTVPGGGGPMKSRMDASVTMINTQKEELHHTPQRLDSTGSTNSGFPEYQRHWSSNSIGERGHAHDPLGEVPLFLGIGIGGDNDGLGPPDPEILAESPSAAEFSIYDTAYQREVERIRAAQGHQATVYLTRRVDSNKEYKADKNMIEAPDKSQVQGMPHEGFKGLLDRAREKDDSPSSLQIKEKLAGTHKFSGLASQALENTKASIENTKSKAMGSEVGGGGHTAFGSLVEAAMNAKKEKEGNAWAADT